MLARLTLLRVLMVLPMLCGACAPCLAAGAAGGDESIVKSRIERPKARVDEVALRYYASRKQTARVEAETRRLRRLYPDWQPPADLWTFKPGSPEDGPLWDLFAAEKLDELRAAIAARIARDSNWTLSSDLEQKLRRKELRVALLANARAKRWGEVASAAGNWRADVAADDVETLWYVAEAFSRIRRNVDALQVLDAILVSSAIPSERTATVQKALGLLSINDVDRLLQRARVDAAGGSEFDGIAVDITRARISALLNDTRARDISATDFAKFRDYAQAASEPDQAALLAWYALKRSDPMEALDQFKTAIAKGGDATVALGLALTLRRLGRLRDAEEVAYAWRDPLPANMTLYIDIVAEELAQRAPMDPKRLARYAEVTLETASGEGAQALAWYAYNNCQMEPASEWFRRAIAWFPKETTALGYALTLQRLKRNRDAVEIINRYDGLFASVVELMFPNPQRAAEDACSKSQVQADGSDNRGAESFMSDLRTASPSQALVAQRKGGRWSVPMPDRIEAGNRERGAPGRGEFPIAVVLENPFRSPAPGGIGVKSPAAGWRPSDVAAPITEARRVPGVVAMPYERFGRTLLPGWNRIQQASSSPNAMLRSPQGTQWAAEQALVDASQRQSADAAAANSAEIGNATAANRFHP
ncbi:MAG: hypothetical protein HXX15_12710 [Rhodopseudomonas sp.]|uniref:hypothetical protein n=1 Tax=Rhodopseudomonas sp. TaxID=1078 RepID=UPI0017A35CA4|nr:hypothetical protein [Rhodopseudomonas sp.]NVN86934.1 hypothetical protein [Rhodopseudomonas sp.]